MSKPPDGPLPPYKPRYQRRAEKREREAEQASAPKAPLKKVIVRVPAEERYNTVHDMPQDNEAAKRRAQRVQRFEAGMEEIDVLAASPYRESEFTQTTTPLKAHAMESRTYREAVYMSLTDEFVDYLMELPDVHEYEESAVRRAVRILQRQSPNLFEYLAACWDVKQQGQNPTTRAVAARLGRAHSTVATWAPKARPQLTRLCAQERRRMRREFEQKPGRR